MSFPELGPTEAQCDSNTIRDWRDKYGGLKTSDLVRVKQLEGGM